MYFHLLFAFTNQSQASLSLNVYILYILCTCPHLSTLVCVHVHTRAKCIQILLSLKPFTVNKSICVSRFWVNNLKHEVHLNNI